MHGAIATIGLVACFLPSTAMTLPAVVVLVVLMWIVAVRRSAAVDAATSGREPTRDQ